LLDVAIAMVFFFLLLSLVCSAANEIFAALLQTRARFLERGIKRLLETDNLTKDLYDHPLIYSLVDEVDPGFKHLHKPLPSYIPSRTFALAVLELFQTNPAVPDRVHKALTSLIAEANGDAHKIRQNVEEWYDNAMERVSGAYKRRTQYVLFTLGIVAAIAVNADSVAVIERLATSKTLSSAVSAAAERYAKNSSQPSLEVTLESLDKLGLPIGWSGPGPDNTPALNDSARLIQVHWIGWLITGLAVSFGAPFWFDLLSRFITVRSTIKPQPPPEQK
jgi:hypothetical protein